MSRSQNQQDALGLQDLVLDADLDLDLTDLTVTSLRDTAALPENGASWGSCSCQGSSSCAQPQDNGPVVL
ncbi:thiazolylpeptide-type bacteriocin [Streptomyces sp. Go40/10]|uniref:thiazolylpeptide-type bacteriocin n=1 Tax=Streptomyces sp. Go40/10 TaxID=2825844 RepID=UPI001E4F7BAB|nr:thiazolylpeptide-type bacteriocin [Streptomyces sp. Go40/10]UFQ99978.1 thiazolylpeptide-type bacteriocin [Streptomyces sp. Go40/10]